MEEPERERGSPVTPIATTPPASHHGVLIDLQSQSSSPGTHVSSTSGVSLGETIRHSASQGMESWYHLPAEEDVSGFALPSCEAFQVTGEDSELPTIEEGALHLGKGVSHSTQLEMQDSNLSPCLPLLTFASAQGPRYFDETLYQQTETEFAPLRETLDMSEFPGQPSLQMSDAVALASKEASEILVGESLTSSEPDTAHDDGQSVHGASPRSPVSHRSTEAFHEADIPGLRNPNVDSPKDPDRVFNSGDGSFLDSSVPAPVLIELLEKEVGLSGSSDLSSRSSSLQTLSSKESDSTRNPPDDGTHDLFSPPSTNDPSEMEDNPLQPEGEIFKDPNEIDFFNADPEEIHERESTGLGRSDQLSHSGITVRTSLGRPSQPGQSDLRQQLCSEIQQRYQEKELVEARERLSKNEDVALQTPCVPRGYSPEASQDETTTAAQLSKEELTISSNASIERGHKDTGISPTDNFPAGEASFMGKLVKPISQSTPGASTVDNVKRKLTDRLMEIKAKLTGSQMSLNEEPSTSLSSGNIESAVKPQSLQSSRADPASSGSQRSPSPQRRRIQSLPSLNYIEKVGSWNTNQSFDALVLRGLAGMSPKKKAFDAVADSLNRMLSKQAGSTSPRRGLSSSFTGASSMTNLNVNERESSGDSLLTRSQSYNSVIAIESGSACNKRPKGVSHPSKEDDERDRSVPVQNRETEDEDAQEKYPLVTNVLDKTKDLQEDELSRGGTQPLVDATPPSSNMNVADRARLDVGSLSLGHFSDVSLDNDLLNSSRSSEPVHQLSADSAAATSALSLTSLEVDNFVPYWTPAHAPLQKEIDIEERIPTYLRNLGIDQSPTAILTPFAPRGPIREPEFSPSELRTIKGSTATPTKSARLSEGGSQSNISQSSVYSTASTASVSIPMGSEVGQESPLRTEISPSHNTRSAADRPDAGSHSVTNRLPHPPVEILGDASELVPAELELQDVHETHPGVPPEVEDGAGSELKHVKKLIEHFESGDVLPDRSHYSLEEKQFLFPLMPKVSDMGQTMGSTNDSFVGSKTLKEIRKLLAEADNIGLGDPGTMFPLSEGVYDDSLKSSGLLNKSTSSLDELVKNMSWNDSLNSSVGNDDASARGYSEQADITWANASVHEDPRSHRYHAEGLAENQEHFDDPLGLHKGLGRFKPEVYKKEVDTLIGYDDRTQEDGDSGKSISREASLEGGYNKDPSGNVACAVGSSELASSRTGAGYIPAREDLPESDDSSADSLAARVMSLLKCNPPLTQTAVSSEDEELRLRSSAKLKLAAPPLLLDTDLNEEDRRRIEEIKRELLEGVKANQPSKDPCSSGFEAAGDVNPFRLQVMPSLLAAQSRGSISRFAGLSAPTIDAGECASRAAASASHRVPVGKDQRTPALPPSDNIAGSNRVSLEKGRGQGEESDSYLAFLPLKPSEETNKLIKSITFSSRKRFSPLLSSIDSEKEEQEQFTNVAGWRSFGETSGKDAREGTSPSDFDSRSNEVSNVNFQQKAPESQSPLHSDADVLDPSPVFGSEGDRPTRYVGDGGLPFLSPTADHHDVQNDHVRPSGRLTPIDGLDALPASHDLPSEGRYGAGPGHGGRPFHSSSDELSVTSSPGRKALSCIHVRISPQQDHRSQADFVLPAPSSAGASDHSKDVRWGGISSPVPRRIEVTPAAEEPFAKSYFLHSPIGAKGSGTKTGGESTGKTENEGHTPAGAAFTERTRIALSDATTQITTESPVKTTFSAEIFIDGSKTKEEPERPSNPKTQGTPEERPAPHHPIPYLSRATDQPLLLPYRPRGSPELFYVPYFDSAPRDSPTSTVESSHPGSNDAVSPMFPSEVLGSAPETPIPRHTQGIYSRSRTPETTGRERPPAGSRGDFDLPTKLQSPFAPNMTRSSQPDREYQFGSFIEPSLSDSLHHRRPRQEPEDKPGRFTEDPASSPPLEDSGFFPLKPEFDYNPDKRPNATRTHRHDPHSKEPSGTQTKRSVGYTSVNTTGVIRSPKIDEKPPHRRDEPTKPKSSGVRENPRGERNTRGSVSGSALPDGHKTLQSIGATLKQSAASNQSLDDLWVRFTHRRRSQLSESSNKLELTLVERLDRLARLLQGSPSQSLVPEKDDAEEIREEPEREDHDERWGREKPGERLRHAKLVEEPEYSSLDETEIPAQPRGRTLLQRLYEDRFSDGSVSSDVSPAVRSSETEIATQTDSEATAETATESLSTIDTVRLIQAFGPERVRPSSKLSKLYDTIDLQRGRTEGKPRKSVRRPAASERALWERSEYSTGPAKMTDLSSTSSGSGQPSLALRHKRSGKLLNKGIQTGDLEIVTSATKRNTRDVGTTFPSPRADTQKVRAESPICTNKEGSSWSEGFVRGKKDKIHLPNGLSWFVPAEVLKRDSRKENESGLKIGPALAWYEPVTSTKPWREPLREKHLQEQLTKRPGSLLSRSHFPTETSTKPLAPFIKVTLQESLETQRPDFIFRSGQRVKRLQLLVKERKLQSEFQEERDKLFNQPEKSVGDDHKKNQKVFRMSQRDRAVLKKEMVQRSKRMYEQLPEVRKRKEDEKRRSEYESNRVKAQIFRRKVTNQVLGRKTPWN